MISYHPERGLGAAAYAAGFRTVDTNAVERIAKGISRYVWSPCVWESGQRKRVNFLRADWAVLDFDSGEMTLAEALKAWCDCIHVIGTTRHHQREKDGKPACDRFRVALLFEMPVMVLEDYEHTMRTLTERYPADPAAKDGARFFFPCAEIVSTSSEGMAEEPQAAPAKAALAERLAAYRFDRWGKAPRWLEDFLGRGEIVAKGRNHTAYCAARKLTELGVEPSAVIQKIMSAPIARDGLKLGEIEAAIANGIAAGGMKHG